MAAARIAVDEQVSAAVTAYVAHGHRLERLCFAAEGCSQSPNTIGEYAVWSSGMSGLAEKVNLSFYFPPPNLRIRAESSGNG